MSAILLIGNALRYQYDAGAAIDMLFPEGSFCFMTVRNFK